MSLFPKRLCKWHSSLSFVWMQQINSYPSTLLLPWIFHFKTRFLLICTKLKEECLLYKSQAGSVISFIVWVGTLNSVSKVRHRFIYHISKSQGEECHFVKSQGMVVHFTPFSWEVAVEIELSLMLWAPRPHFEILKPLLCMGLEFVITSWI